MAYYSFSYRSEVFSGGKSIVMQISIIMIISILFYAKVLGGQPHCHPAIHLSIGTLDMLKP